MLPYPNFLQLKKMDAKSPSKNVKSEAVELQNNLTKLYNDSNNVDSKFIQEAEIIGPIIVVGVAVFLLGACCCACGSDNRGDTTGSF
jgi:hypothetical protein